MLRHGRHNCSRSVHRAAALGGNVELCVHTQLSIRFHGTPAARSTASLLDKKARAAAYVTPTSKLSSPPLNSGSLSLKRQDLGVRQQRVWESRENTTRKQSTPSLEGGARKLGGLEAAPLRNHSFGSPGQSFRRGGVVKPSTEVLGTSSRPRAAGARSPPLAVGGWVTCGC